MKARGLLSPVRDGGTETFQPRGQAGTLVVDHAEFSTVVHDQVCDWFDRMGFEEAVMIVEDRDPEITNMPLIDAAAGVMFMGYPGHPELNA